MLWSNSVCHELRIALDLVISLTSFFSSTAASSCPNERPLDSIDLLEIVNAWANKHQLMTTTVRHQTGESFKMRGVCPSQRRRFILFIEKFTRALFLFWNGKCLLAHVHLLFGKLNKMISQIFPSPNIFNICSIIKWIRRIAIERIPISRLLKKKIHQCRRPDCQVTRKLNFLVVLVAVASCRWRVKLMQRLYDWCPDE